MVLFGLVCWTAGLAQACLAWLLWPVVPWWLAAAVVSLAGTAIKLGIEAHSRRLTRERLHA